MRVAIYKDNLVKFNDFNKKYGYILEHNGIDHVFVNINDSEFWDEVDSCDAFIYRWTHHDGPTIHADVILPIINQYLKIPCFPDLNASWLFNDKIKEYYLLEKFGYPVVESFIFWTKGEATRWMKEREVFPVVFKLKRGAGSNNVILVKSRDDGLKLIKRMFGKGILTGEIPDDSSLTKKDTSKVIEIYRELKKQIKYRCGNYEVLDWVPHKNYVYFQEFHPDNSYDVRVTIIGNRAFSFKRSVREGDFRASGSGQVDYSIDDVDQRCIDIAFRVSQKFNYRSMAYDFIYDKNKSPLLVEISYTYNDIAIFKCPGFWDKNNKWIEGNYWPQYLHLVDLLDNPGLIQPFIQN